MKPVCESVKSYLFIKEDLPAPGGPKTPMLSTDGKWLSAIFLVTVLASKIGSNGSSTGTVKHDLH